MSNVDEQGRTHVEKLEQALEQACYDLNQAHDEIMKAQGASNKEAQKHDWPEWTPQANTIRWAERILEKRLSKTRMWTNYPDMEVGEGA